MERSTEGTNMTESLMLYGSLASAKRSEYFILFYLHFSSLQIDSIEERRYRMVKLIEFTTSCGLVDA